MPRTSSDSYLVNLPYFGIYSNNNNISNNSVQWMCRFFIKGQPPVLATVVPLRWNCFEDQFLKINIILYLYQKSTTKLIFNWLSRSCCTGNHLACLKRGGDMMMLLWRRGNVQKIILEAVTQCCALCAESRRSNQCTEFMEREREAVCPRFTSYEDLQNCLIYI